MYVIDAVCQKMFGQKLTDIRSRAARQKFLRKKVKKVNRDKFRELSFDYIVYLLQNRRELNICHAVCGTVIGSIADRVHDGEPEPDVDNFENLFSLMAQQVDTSAYSS